MARRDDDGGRAVIWIGLGIAAAGYFICLGLQDVANAIGDAYEEEGDGDN